MKAFPLSQKCIAVLEKEAERRGITNTSLLESLVMELLVTRS